MVEKAAGAGALGVSRIESDTQFFCSLCAMTAAWAPRVDEIESFN